MAVGLEARVNYQEQETVNPSLQNKIKDIRQNRQEYGLHSNWSDLPGTGFQVQKQIELLYSDQNTTETKTEKLDRWLTQTREDIKGFAIEYLAEGLVFPIFYKIDYVDGKERVVAPLYGNRKMVDTVSSEERHGVVKKILEEKLEPFFLNAPVGAIAVMTSPSGWSGLKDQEGNAIEFPDSQTYIFQKRENEIAGFTIRTDFSEEEHKEFIERLSGRELPSGMSVCDFVDNVVFLKRGEIEDVVDTMKDTRFDKTGGSLLAYKNRFWKEVYSDLKRREELWTFDEKTKELVSEFEDFVLTYNYSEKELKEALAITVLSVAHVVKGGVLDKKSYSGMEVHFDRHADYIAIPYADILKKTQEVGGCAGGGNGFQGSQLFVSSITPRHAFLEQWDFKSQDEYGSLEFDCPHCEGKNKRSPHKLIENCQSCGKSVRC